MRRAVTCAGLIVATALGVAGSVAAEGGRDAEIAAFVERAREAHVVILGEIHDNPEHHRVQAEIVEALEPAALVFEMIPQEREGEVEALRAAGAGRGAIAEALDWEERGWPAFDLYAPILEAAPEARVFGAEQPMEEVARAMREGAADAFGPDAALYGLDVDLPEAEQAAREAIQAEAHCGMLPEEMLAGMVEAQRFRDAGLADAALWARMATGDGLVVVVAGSGHADRERGAPALLAEASPETVVLSLGQFEGAAPEGETFDAVIHAPAPERGDPCDAFRPAED